MSATLNESESLSGIETIIRCDRSLLTTGHYRLRVSRYKMPILIRLIAFAFLLATIAPPAYAQNVQGTVISTGDGDTFRAKIGDKIQTIRMTCIDAPETGQRPWGQQAANRLKQLLPTGQAINLRIIEKDRYSRTVAEVYKNNQSVNLQMVKEGHAVVYRQYLQGCANTQNQFLQAEATAKKQRLAFWNQANPVMPWDFRRTAKNQPTSKPQAGSAAQNAKNCKELAAQGIQNISVAQNPWAARLDRDNDGIACES